jgi:hypothetical protein
MPLDREREMSGTETDVVERLVHVRNDLFTVDWRRAKRMCRIVSGAMLVTFERSTPIGAVAKDGGVDG